MSKYIRVNGKVYKAVDAGKVTLEGVNSAKKKVEAAIANLENEAEKLSKFSAKNTSVASVAGAKALSEAVSRAYRLVNELKAAVKKW